MAMRHNFNQSTRWMFNFKAWQPTEGEWCNAIMHLNEDERRRIGKFRYRDDAKASLVGRLMIRLWSKKFLSYCSCPDLKLSISRTEKGRPKLTLSPIQIESTRNINFDFNVAHAGDLTVFAAEFDSIRNISVGVDVMPLFDKRRDQNMENFLRLMKRQFTLKEWNQIQKSSINCDDINKDTMKRFYRFWCLKESFVKAEGSGLAWDLQRLSFNCPTVELSSFKIVKDTILNLDGCPVDTWEFQEHLLHGNHCAAVAVNINDVSEVKTWPIFESVNLHDLLSQDSKVKDFNKQERIEWDIFLSMIIEKPF